MPKTILLISNGHGEDIIGANILRELINETTDLKIKVLPIVGEGQAYQAIPVELVGPRKVLPSGGFMRNSLSNLWMDIRGGILGLTLAQIGFLRKIRQELDLVLVVGDIYILLLAGLFVRKKIIFLPTAKSEYIEGHYGIEKTLMKKMADIVLPRDDKTTRVLKEAGVNALFVGNAMMDCFQIKGADFYLEEDERVVGILPGSRDEAYQNILDILQAIVRIELLAEEKITYLTAMAGNLKLTKLKNKLEKTDWLIKEPSSRERETGIELKLLSPGGFSNVKIIYHHFGDILNQAELFIGLAGTANEQAAGMGKPVVTFPGKGSQFTEKFARDQKSLLGESVALIANRPEEIAGKVMEILTDRDLYSKMSQAGRQRMGEPGAIKRMVRIIKEFPARSSENLL